MRSIATRTPRHAPAWWGKVWLRVLALALVGTFASLGSAVVVGWSASLVDHGDAIRADLSRIGEDVLEYRGDTGDWPTSLRDLYEEPPTDPWGHPYRLVPAEAGRECPEVVSLGSDGWPGGRGAAADRWRAVAEGPVGALDTDDGRVGA